MTGAGVISASAAEPDAFNPMKAVLEMQKNIAWTVDGLYQLGKTSDRTLKLTKTQAKKLLPIYQKLIAKKIIRLEMKKDSGKPPRDGAVRPRKAGQPGARRRRHQMLISKTVRRWPFLVIPKWRRSTGF
jgi:hypothetical protein